MQKLFAQVVKTAADLQTTRSAIVQAELQVQEAQAGNVVAGLQAAAGAADIPVEQQLAAMRRQFEVLKAEAEASRAAQRKAEEAVAASAAALQAVFPTATAGAAVTATPPAGHAAGPPISALVCVGAPGPSAVGSVADTADRDVLMLHDGPSLPPSQQPDMEGVVQLLDRGRALVLAATTSREHKPRRSRSRSLQVGQSS